MGTDEHEDVYSARGISRRRSDIDAAGEVHLLWQELKNLRETLGKDEDDYEERLAKLEADCAEFRRKIAYGKGVFYGIGAGVSVFVFFTIDTLKTALAHFMSLTK